MAEEWIMVRVAARVHFLLETTRQSMELADTMRLRELARDPRGRVSLSQIIEELIYFRLKHRERVRKSKMRRKRHKPILPEDPPID